MRGVQAWLAALLLTTACGSEDAVEKTPPGPPPTSVVLYGPAAETELTLFPSNRYTVPDAASPTGLRVSITAENTTDSMVTAYPGTVAQLDEMDGFSTTGGVIVKFSAPIDPRGIDQLPEADPPILDPARDASEYQKPDAPFLLVNVDEASPEYGQALGIVPRWFEQAQDEFYLFDEFTLVAQPAVPLRPGTRYAFVITDALTASDGTPVGASDAMKAALGKASDAYSQELRAAVSIAEDKVGIDAKHVVAATTFTTASVHTGIEKMAEARRAAPAPQQVDPWTVETAQSPPDPRVRFRASFEAPEYRKAKPDGKWELDASGAPTIQKTENLEVFLAFSDAEKSGKRPVVIFQHGLGGDKDGCWGTSQRLAAVSDSGVAVLAIDSPEHGSRTKGDTGLISSVYGFFGIDPDTQDFDIGRARDNFRQMAGDQLELVRFIQTLVSLDLLPVGAPDGVPDLDTSRIYYIGHSFGSVQGATIFALAPEIQAATWNVGGAGLMTLLRDSQLFSVVVNGLTPPGTPFGAVARFMAASQALVDPGDPLNYARQEPLAGVPDWKPRSMLLQEVVNDNIVPNSTSEALGRAAGLELMHRVSSPSGFADVTAPASGNLPGGATGVICQFDTMNGGETAKHGDLIFAPEAQAQYVEFFKSDIAGSAVVNAPY
ncbi:MAG: alpha/beta fold hydrolase [Myxococcales bacterium]|nr:alpha/beta fold hydrolase [Myxococcales bacterium]